MIDIDSVHVELGDNQILQNVSLQVETGEFLALIGPNGAGKTTLLRAINGLVAPTSGTVSIDGHDISALSSKAVGRLVTTVPQETSLGFDFDVEDIVTMGRTPHRGRFSPLGAADRTAVETALERTETAQFAERPVGDLSGGERQRVLLARALAQETPVLLLDEPTASLDINHQFRTLSLARELADDDKTVVAAIHDIELAARFCDTIAVLDGGGIRALGSPSTVLTDETLEEAFGVRTVVGTNSATGGQTVTPVSDVPPNDTRVHIVGGGERAAGVIARLSTAGIAVSVGILPENDAAVNTARRLAEDVVIAPPFSSPDLDTQRRAAALQDDAVATVLTSVPSTPNQSLVGEADGLVALEGIDHPAATHTTSERNLIATIRRLSGMSEPTDAPQNSNWQR
ncbi:ATP-binding cassette domain-containing protein [Natronomonas sp. F2-12]|uniref:Cobalamin import ATP-binding protein BtuD n=1 Tax=Natronomonas aquatica TaxID=2841590 RepID=A0A9R1CV58_9EURY|nr:ATP-binding cassette domain-containing protein [Natronomonas aquatica]